MEGSIQGGAFLVHLPQELLSDAQWHYEQAAALEPGSDPFVLWRHVRSAAVFGVTAVEALLNMAAAEFVQANPGQEPAILDYLQEQESYVDGAVVKKRFRAVRLEDKICNWTQIMTGRRFDRSDLAWQQFSEVKDFRNALIHYDPTVTDVYARGTVATAKQAVESSLAMIVRYYECNQQEMPRWIDELAARLAG